MSSTKTTAGKKLLMSVKRAQQNSAVPIGAYDEDSLRLVVGECEKLSQNVRELVERHGEDFEALSEGVKGTLLIQSEAIRRNRDCGVAYLQRRLDALTKLRLDAGLVLPENIRNNMSPHEAAFYSDYDLVLSDFMRDLGVDLTAQLQPPGDLYVEVRCKVDCGELVTENSGIVNLQAGTSHYLRASDVQHLIAQGLLEHVG